MSYCNERPPDVCVSQQGTVLELTKTLGMQYSLFGFQDQECRMQYTLFAPKTLIRYSFKAQAQTCFSRLSLRAALFVCAMVRSRRARIEKAAGRPPTRFSDKRPMQSVSIRPTQLPHGRPHHRSHSFVHSSPALEPLSSSFPPLSECA